VIEEELQDELEMEQRRVAEDFIAGVWKKQTREAS
jgi:hypothetical protein